MESIEEHNFRAAAARLANPRPEPAILPFLSDKSIAIDIETFGPAAYRDRRLRSGKMPREARIAQVMDDIVAATVRVEEASYIAMRLTKSDQIRLAGLPKLDGLDIGQADAWERARANRDAMAIALSNLTLWTKAYDLAVNEIKVLEPEASSRHVLEIQMKRLRSASKRLALAHELLSQAFPAIR